MATIRATGGFGPHLMLDLYGCDEKILNDVQILYILLEELPTKLGMRILVKPYVVHAEGNHKRDPGGWSGFVIIQESHVSLHTFPKKKFLTADIYSCKPFNTNLAIAHFKKIFKPKEIDVFLQDRGLRYPL